MHSWGGGDPTILYNITGYGLNGLFFEIQTETRFPINFNWEISVAWVRTLHEQNLGWEKRSGFFKKVIKFQCPGVMLIQMKIKTPFLDISRNMSELITRRGDTRDETFSILWPKLRTK